MRDHHYIIGLGLMPDLGRGLTSIASAETGNSWIAPAGSAAPLWLRIQPSRGWAALNLVELWQYRELIFFLAWRDVKVRYKQTIIGVVWVLLQPSAMMGVFWLLFGRMAKLPSDDLPYPLFVLVGLLPWQFFSRVFSESTCGVLRDLPSEIRAYASHIPTIV